MRENCIKIDLMSEQPAVSEEFPRPPIYLNNSVIFNKVRRERNSESIDDDLDVIDCSKLEPPKIPENTRDIYSIAYGGYYQVTNPSSQDVDPNFDYKKALVK